MSPRSQIIVAAVLGQFVGLLGYVDEIFFPLVLAGPLVVGAVAAAIGLSPWVAPALWASAGLNMLWMDWVFAHEDVLFHLVLAGVMAILAAAGYGLVAILTRRRERVGA